MVTSHQSLHGVDCGLVLLGHTSPKQHPGEVSRHSRSDAHPNLHPNTHVDALDASFAPSIENVHTGAS